MKSIAQQPKKRTRSQRFPAVALRAKPAVENTTKGKQPVVLVMSVKSRPKMALIRAYAFARRLSAPLHVLVCMQSEPHSSVLFPHCNPSNGMLHQLQVNLASKRVWRWCNKNLLQPITPDQVMILQGDLPGCAASAAKMLKALLVVVPESEITRGTDVTAIVEDAGVSVLVSRPAAPRNTVVAATDLSLNEVPVLRKGVFVGDTIEAPVAFVHNVAPELTIPHLLAGGYNAVFVDESIKYTESLRQKRKSNLDATAENLGGEINTRITTNVDTVEAILGFARSQQADLVVVGHRRRSWLRRIFGERVAAGVVGRARRSVMVVPVTNG